jgi:hypothetical protein
MGIIYESLKDFVTLPFKSSDEERAWARRVVFFT